MNWREVVLEFDHPEFYLPEVEGLRMIMKAYKHATSVSVRSNAHHL
jgi:CO dehydrogenase/acetyl-CoA synthase beta subunit